MRGPRTRVGAWTVFWGFALAVGRVCPILLLAPDRRRGSYERVAGSRVGPWADREATRSALEAVTREWETRAARGKQRRPVPQVLSVGFGWVLGVRVSFPSLEALYVTRGSCA